MFDLGWSKLIVIAIVAIIVVGPKDLPPLLRAIGKFVAQLRRQAEEFRSHFNEAMRDTGLDEIRRDISSIKQTASSAAGDIQRSLDESVQPVRDAAADIQRAGERDAVEHDVAKAAATPGDPVTSYMNGTGEAAATPHGVTDMPEIAPAAINGQNGHAMGHAAPKMPTSLPPALESEIKVPAAPAPADFAAATAPPAKG